MLQMFAHLKICVYTFNVLLAVETIVKIKSRNKRNMFCTKFQHIRACLCVNHVTSTVYLVQRVHYAFSASGYIFDLFIPEPWICPLFF